MIIEIALGIVLAVIILMLLPTIIAMGIVAVGIALAIGAIVLVVMAVQSDPFYLAFTAIVILLLLPVAILHWRDNKNLEGMRKKLGYEDTRDSEGFGK